MSEPSHNLRILGKYSARMLAGSIGLGLSMLVAVAAAYAWAAASGRSEGEVRALGFAAVVFGNLMLILATRTRERSMLATLLRPNPAFWRSYSSRSAVMPSRT